MGDGKVKKRRREVKKRMTIVEHCDGTRQSEGKGLNVITEMVILFTILVDFRL